jgi:hypothetical protein
MRDRLPADQNGYLPDEFTMTKKQYITPEDYTRAAAHGISAKLLGQRVYGYGWEKEAAITTPKGKGRNFAFHALANKNGISDELFQVRVTKLGWTKEKAATAPLYTRLEYGAEIKKWIVLAQRNGIHRQAFRRRLRKFKWTLEKAATVPITNQGNKRKPKEEEVTSCTL